MGSFRRARPARRAARRFPRWLPLAASGRRWHDAAPVPVPANLPVPRGDRLSTQEAFGRILGGIAASDAALAARIVTTSPDVTVSTNLGAWVNRRGIFDRAERADTFREEKVVSAQRWAMAPQGQHIELGIAESNLFLQLAALGLSGPLFGTRLLPIGTLYDPFIKRGLDALNYALYQDARFILVATPSGVTLAPEGGAHQSVVEPLIGLAQPGLAGFEPAYADELAVLLRWALAEIQRETASRSISGCRRGRSSSRNGGSTRTRRSDHRRRLLAARAGARGRAGDRLLRRGRARGDRRPSADRRGHARSRAAGDHLARPAAPRLAGGVRAGWAERGRAAAGAAAAGRRAGHRRRQSSGNPVVARRRRPQPVVPLGVDRFGQSGDIPDLYRVYGIDSDAIVDAAARACLLALG